MVLEWIYNGSDLIYGKVEKYRWFFKLTSSPNNISHFLACLKMKEKKETDDPVNIIGYI